MTDVKALDPEALRAKARLVTAQLLDAVEDRASSMDNEDLTAALNAAGKLTGVQVTTQNVTGSVAHLHLDALRAITQRLRVDAPSQPPQLVASQHDSDDTGAA